MFVSEISLNGTGRIHGKCKKVKKAVDDVGRSMSTFYSISELCGFVPSTDLNWSRTCFEHRYLFSREPLVPCRVVLYLSSVALTLLFIYIFVYYIIMVYYSLMWYINLPFYFIPVISREIASCLNITSSLEIQVVLMYRRQFDQWIWRTYPRKLCRN